MIYEYIMDPGEMTALIRAGVHVRAGFGLRHGRGAAWLRWDTADPPGRDVCALAVLRGYADPADMLPDNANGESA